jgi:hypothetical protein
MVVSLVQYSITVSSVICLFSKAASKDDQMYASVPPKVSKLSWGEKFALCHFKRPFGHSLCDVKSDFSSAAISPAEGLS